MPSKNGGGVISHADNTLLITPISFHELYEMSEIKYSNNALQLRRRSN